VIRRKFRHNLVLRIAQFHNTLYGRMLEPVSMLMWESIGLRVLCSLTALITFYINSETDEV